MLNTDLKLLAFVPKLEGSVRLYCARREQKFPYFREGYVDLNLGRHVHLTEAIRAATEHYAVADAKGVVHAKYQTLGRAVEAIERARPTLIPDLGLEPDEIPEAASAGA